MTETMKAAVIREWGGPERLEIGEVQRPQPPEGWISVRVEACALNHLDIFVRRGLPGVRLELPHVSGGDIVGVVDRATSNRGEALVGRRVLLDPIIPVGKGYGVLGEHAWGGLAEHVIAPAENAIPLDDGEDPVRYAAIPIAYGTAHRMLFNRAGLERGETVLLLGATGGVGLACLQFGVRAGARVIACSASPEKRVRLRELGAAETIDVAREDLRVRVKELTDGHGADLVVDYQGKDTWPTTLRCVRAGGRVVTCGATTGFEAMTDLRYVWTREMQILGSNGWRREDLDAILAMIAAGELDPIVHGVFGLEDARAAVAELEERRAFGKVVVRVD